MARTIEEIQKEILIAKENNLLLASELKDKSTSKTAIWRLWIYVFSFAQRTQELLYDAHRKEVDYKIENDKKGRLPWYRKMALQFQYGFDLKTDSDQFDIIGFTSEEIEASKIIKYAAVTEIATKDRGRALILKIATELNGKLAPVTTSQFKAFVAYIEEVKFAGVYVTVTNYLPDRLRLNIRIVRDALVLDENGIHRVNGTLPVNEKINKFMKELPFDGALSLQALEERILSVEGVNDLKINIAETAWINADTNTYGSYQPIDISVIPISGYFEVSFDNDNELKSTITYA